MINIRETEIRDESLLLTIAAYDLVNSLNGLLSMEEKNELVDRSFLVSSLIAEAFSTSRNEISEKIIVRTLDAITGLREKVEKLTGLAEMARESTLEFLNRATMLEAELLTLRNLLGRLMAEEFSPKIELACI